MKNSYNKGIKPHVYINLEERTKLGIDGITEALSFCLNTTYFAFQVSFYKQTQGAAMGSTVSPLIANLYMGEFEHKALNSFQHPIQLWMKYVDDTGVVIKRALVPTFTNHLNSQHPAIKFTIEEEKDGKLPMLDVLIKRNTNGSLSFSVYRKPTHTDHYLQFQSHQPLQHKLGVIRTLRHRCSTHVSEPREQQSETEHVKKVLAIAGYPKWAWDQTSVRAERRPSNTTTAGISSKPRHHVGLPYCRGLSEPIARRIRRAGVSVYMKPMTNLRRLLVAPKDPLDTLEKSGVVYELQCKDCDARYIGETERPLRARVREHQRHSSPVTAHASSQQHTIDFEHVKVLDQEQQWFRRGVKEALHIEAKGATLNRDKGRHYLAPGYKTLIHSCGQWTRSIAPQE